MSEMTHKNLYDELEKRRSQRIEPTEKMYEVEFSIKFVAKSALSKDEIAKIGSFLVGINKEDRESYQDSKNLQFKDCEIKKINSFKHYN